MTLHATAKPSHARDTDAATVAALAIAVIAALTLAGAWFFQLVLDIRPCPLCLEQRYAWYLAIPLGVLLALAASRGAPRALLVAGFALLTLALLANAWLAGYHAGVEWGFWPGPTACTGTGGDLSFGDLSSGTIDKVIPCDQVQWRDPILKFSLAGYNTLLSAAIVVMLLGAMLFQSRRKAG